MTNQNKIKKQGYENRWLKVREAQAKALIQSLKVSIHDLKAEVKSLRKDQEADYKLLKKIFKKIWENNYKDQGVVYQDFISKIDERLLNSGYSYLYYLDHKEEEEQERLMWEHLESLPEVNSDVEGGDLKTEDGN